MQKPQPIKNDGLVQVTEPMEGAFTLLMPQGWNNQAHLQREHALNRIIASAVRPDEGAMIHLGDPRLPIFREPSPFVDPVVMQFNSSTRIQPYTPADYFFRDYVQQCFGKAPGFRLNGVAECPDLVRTTVADHRRAGRAVRVTAAAVSFQHVHNGREMQCRVHGVATGFNGMWTVDLFTASATAELEEVCGLALRMFLSRHYNPAWAAAQQGLHNQKMAIGRQQDQFINQMTDLQAQGHRQRMEDIQNAGAANTRMHEERMAQNDASHQAWMAGQAQSDAQQRSWMSQQVHDDQTQQSRINALREEQTAVDSDGTSYQVDIQHERYFVNKRDNTYIGAGAVTERNDLQRLYGVNPEDFEEVKVVR
jgi:hypothetical protein